MLASFQETLTVKRLADRRQAECDSLEGRVLVQDDRGSRGTLGAPIPC